MARAGLGWLVAVWLAASFPRQGAQDAGAHGGGGGPAADVSALAALHDESDVNTCAETAVSPSVPADFAACLLVTALETNEACLAVMTEADPTVAACTFTANDNADALDCSGMKGGEEKMNFTAVDAAILGTVCVSELVLVAAAMAFLAAFLMAWFCCSYHGVGGFGEVRGYSIHRPAHFLTHRTGPRLLHRMSACRLPRTRSSKASRPSSTPR